MENKQVSILDGSKEEREQTMKEFFGLSPEQSFQDLEIEDEEE